MIAELGQLAVILALGFALLQGGMPLAGLWRGRPVWVAAAPVLAAAQFIFLAVALLLLAAAFVRHDFSVLYVANNSNTALPLLYRLAAVWGGHEGSLLLWVFMLSAWTVAVAATARHMAQAMQARVIGVLGLLSVGFLLFMLLTSNPFARLLPAPLEGRDLNPLLQDFALAVHPPMLYMGYVGFSVAFAFAVAALLSGQMDSAWVKWARPWTLLAWVFLTVGIMLGSWWAYYELGWGGWWFWDPVENASFMPWLAGTALLHSLAATEARGVFKPWTSLLAILTFSLCLLGTFLVRSGILTSVHAFAVDPARGGFILLLLILVVGGSLILYAWRVPLLQGGGRFALLSRETGILLNNIFLTVAAFSVLLGTFYPLILDALGVGKVSVGAPYFNLVFASLMAVPVGLMAVGAMSRWKSDSVLRLAIKLRQPFVIAPLLGVLLPWLADGDYQWTAVPGLTLACWVFLGTAVAAAERIKTRMWNGGAVWGMLLAHAGVAVFIFGVTLVNVYEKEKDVRLAVGETQTLGDYVFRLQNIYEEKGENYVAVVADLQVNRNGKTVAVLHPEKRRYAAQPENFMTEAGIAVGWGGDLYVSLGEPLGDGAWSARLQIKPFVRFIWGGALLMALGGLVAVADRRYRRHRQQRQQRQ